MRKKITEQKLNRELSILGWVLMACALLIIPFYVRCLLKYKRFDVRIAGDESFAFSHELSVDIMDVVGSTLIFALPVSLLATLVIGLTMILNARKRKLLKKSNQE